MQRPARRAGHGVNVRTVRQVIGGPVCPEVAGPVPRPIPPPGVVNARLSAVAAGRMPACFQAGRYGTNHATFRYQRRAGPGGAGAEVISLTQRKSGPAQIVPIMDLGACVPAATAGRLERLDPGDLDCACRPLRGDRGQLRPGASLGRHT